MLLVTIRYTRDYIILLFGLSGRRMCVGIKLHPECSLLYSNMTAYCSEYIVYIYIPNVVLRGVNPEWPTMVYRALCLEYVVDLI